MAKRIIEISVNDEYVVGSGVVIGAAGSYHDVDLKVKFSESWDGLYKYATFRDAKGEKPTVVMITEMMLADFTSDEDLSRTYIVPVPAAAERFAGQCLVTFSGFAIGEDENGERVVMEVATNSATAKFRILPSDYSFIEDEVVAAGTVAISAAELMDLIDQAKASEEYARECAEAADESAQAAIDCLEKKKEEIAQMVLSEFVDGNDVSYTGEEAG